MTRADQPRLNAPKAHIDRHVESHHIDTRRKLGASKGVPKAPIERGDLRVRKVIHAGAGEAFGLTPGIVGALSDPLVRAAPRIMRVVHLASLEGQGKL